MANEITNIPESKLDYATMLAKSDMMPKHLRGKPSDVLWAIEFASALGVPPMTAFTSIHVIEGKPSASASLLSALVRRAGHILRVTGDDKCATAILIRKDDPTFEHKTEWTIARAQNAGLTGKDNWRKYPGAMLKARAISEVCRMGAEDALLGLDYTPEELGAEVDAAGTPTKLPTQQAAISVESEPVAEWLDADRKAFMAELSRLGFKYEDVKAWLIAYKRPAPRDLTEERRRELLVKLGNGMGELCRKWIAANRSEKASSKPAEPRKVQDAEMFDGEPNRQPQGNGCGVCGVVTELARGVCLDCASDPDKQDACNAAAAEWQSKQ